MMSRGYFDAIFLACAMEETKGRAERYVERMNDIRVEVLKASNDLEGQYHPGGKEAAHRALVDEALRKLEKLGLSRGDAIRHLWPERRKR